MPPGRERRVLELFVDCLGWQFYERKRSVFLMATQLLDFVFVDFVHWVHVMCTVVCRFEGCLFHGFCVGFALVGVGIFCKAQNCFRMPLFGLVVCSAVRRVEKCFSGRSLRSRAFGF